MTAQGLSGLEQKPEGVGADQAFPTRMNGQFEIMTSPGMLSQPAHTCNGLVTAWIEQHPASTTALVDEIVAATVQKATER